jgi:hypothetical protein
MEGKAYASLRTPNASKYTKYNGPILPKVKLNVEPKMFDLAYSMASSPGRHAAKRPIFELGKK